MARNQNNIGTKMQSNTGKIKPGAGRTKKKKFKNSRLFKILRIALVLIILLFIINIISDLFHKNSDKITLVIGENKISLKHDVLLDEYNNFYLSLDDMANIYDANIYYSNDTIITTYNKHIAVLKMDKTTMSINDTVTEINGTLKKKDGIVYLPFSDMELVYDFEYLYNKDEKVLIVDSLSDSKSEAIVLKNCKLKNGTGFFDKKLEKVKKSEVVTVLGVEGKYTKVRTNSGNVGFVKTKKLDKVQVKREKMDEENITNIKVLDEYSVVDSTYGALESNDSATQITIPKLYNILEDFSVKSTMDLSGAKFTSYKEWANNNNVLISAVVSMDASMNKLCSSFDTRTYVINSIYIDVIKNQLTSVCIDFDSIDDTEGFYRFIIEMVPRFKEAGIKVFVKYKDGMNKERLNKIVDYVIE